MVRSKFENDETVKSDSDNARKAKGSKVTYWPKFYREYIPMYRLYDGWEKVFEWAKQNNIMIGVLGKAKAELVRKTFEKYELPSRLDVSFW